MKTEKSSKVNEFMLYGIENDIKRIIQTFIYRRVEMGLSQKELAERIGLKQSAIARFETQKLFPRIDTIMLIARALDLQISFKKIMTGWEK